MRKLLHSIFIVLALGWGMSFAPAAQAAVTLPWSTTYNCPDWTQSDGLYPPAINCDGLTGFGDWTCDNGDGTVREEQITAAANFASGAGGRGQRQWVGDGANNNSGGLRVPLSRQEPELWIRWYMRYQQGFSWEFLNNDKILYINPGSPHCVIPEWYGFDYANVATCRSPNNHLSAPGHGWNGIMGSNAADGQWHMYEVHLKMDTNGSDGIAEMWIDGVQRLSHSNVDFATQAGWDNIGLGNNQRNPLNGRCMAVDFDDFAVRTTGPIGPVGPADTLAPAAPSNLTVQ